MKIIGVYGMSGSGKTTFANMLLKDKNVHVIHMDNVFDKLKKSVFKNSVKTFERGEGEKITYLNRQSFMYKMSRAKMLNNIFETLKIQYAKYELNKEINFWVKQGVEYLIIESYMLDSFIDFEQLDYTIFISAAAPIRKERVLKRDNCIEHILEDQFYESDEITTNNFDMDFVVENNSSFDNLQKSALAISDAIIKDFSLARKK